ncbi:MULTISPECIES: FadR/GntR family transcriptional regulator [Streptomyces]|uniref:GntR family transcriptional regulator n=2 Tax=Streptomyces TaxID=1883 RepID=A0A101QBK6_STRCK|nr:GntR family transcriptional regulator [Streptomyces corchorusii]KUN26927.1 GntR family transcriptional regulator [Streptomyces corchorusii]
MPHPQGGPAPDGPAPDAHGTQPAGPQPAAAAALPFNAPALDGIRRLTALETVRARIGLAVDLGLLAPGEKLPPTDRIAAALDVGEITVRRALSTLCQDGVLERRRGRNGGTRVAERPARGVVGAMDSYRAQNSEVHALVDQRLVLECGLAHLAARNADEAALAHLERLADEMDRVPTWAEFHGCDERFHLAVAAATGVPAAAEAYRGVLQQLYRYYLPYPMDALRESNREHRALVDALRAGDTAAAADIARRHVEVLHRTMFVGLLETAEGRGAEPRGTG